MTAWVVKGRISKKMYLQSVSELKGESEKRFVEYMNKFRKVNYDWTHYRREYESVKITINEEV